MKLSSKLLKSTRTGFTLVELVVVILVLGIIAAIAAPKMFDTATDARENVAIKSLAVLRDAVELHRAQHGSYPGDLGTDVDLKNDLTAFLKGPFPKNTLSAAAGDRSVAVQTTGTALTASGAEDWKYDNVSGDIIINTAGFDTF